MNVWVALQSGPKALALATKEVELAGWSVVKVDDVARVERTELDDPAALEYFEQCLVDQVVLVFHTWSSFDQEDQEVH